MSETAGHVAIIGSGVIGTACAYFLSNAGWKVTMLEKGGFGQACSHANCGLVVPSHVLPLAMPGVMTGAILSLAHALGETAPLLMIGMISFVPGAPETFTSSATVLPVQVFIWENASERAFHERTAGAIIVLLVFMILMNLTAILLRRRFERRW